LLIGSQQEPGSVMPTSFAWSMAPGKESLNMQCKFCWVVFVVISSAGSARAADWPHWLGPKRNGSSPETGLLTTWPSTGPKVLWEAKGGDGYSSIAVADGRAITLVQRGGKEVVLALDAAKGTERCQTPLTSAYKNMYGNGPRSTPSIEADAVYVTSVTG